VQERGNGTVQSNTTWVAQRGLTEFQWAYRLLQVRVVTVVPQSIHARPKEPI
jgi:hypothetical protein